MPRIKPNPLATLVVVLSCACGGGGAAPPSPDLTTQGACDTVALRGSCVAYSDMTAADLATQRTVCEQYQGTFGTTCPGAGLFGTCTISYERGRADLRLYFAVSETICTNGAWSAPTPPVEAATPASVSCSDPWAGTCADTTGPMTPTVKRSVERYCTGNDRTLLAGPCPVTGRVGTCTTRPGALTWDTRHHDAAAAATQAILCGLTGGTWTDG
ncbi:MAG: hypothetical protein IPO09_05865 [Anaeromyxobacter sp.]|nr:hypothetical protein [Anaeromyxobacter sp.]